LAVNRAATSITSSYKELWRQFYHSPELVATLSIPITDIIGDRPDWTDLDGMKLSGEELKKARKFYTGNRGKETIMGWLFDDFLTGDSYMWLGKPSVENVKNAVKEVITAKFGKQDFRVKEIRDLSLMAIKAIQDEDLKKPKEFDYVASSTVTIVHDALDVLFYEQLSNGLTATFTPEEIIHHRHMSLNGMITGFSPAESLFAEIMLLRLVKGNMLSFLKNGGAPDKAFILPKEIANSPNHQFLIQTLQKYKKIENRHGNLVFTGEIEVQDLQGNPKDLEYKDLALYITSNIAYAYRIPVTRIPYLIGANANKGDSGGLSETGYWNMISEKQDSVEDLLNAFLFGPHGWNIKLNRKYKQDEVREVQTASMNADNVSKIQLILKANDLQMKDNKILRMLNMSEDEIEVFIPSTYQFSNPNYP